MKYFYIVGLTLSTHLDKVKIDYNGKRLLLLEP